MRCKDQSRGTTRRNDDQTVGEAHGGPERVPHVFGGVSLFPFHLQCLSLLELLLLFGLTRTLGSFLTASGGGNVVVLPRHDRNPSGTEMAGHRGGLFLRYTVGLVEEFNFVLKDTGNDVGLE